jgi:hypothetical protein
MTNNQNQKNEAFHENDVQKIQNSNLDFESSRRSNQRVKKFASRAKRTFARLESFEFFSSSFSSSMKDESEFSFFEKKSFSSNEKKANSNALDSAFRFRSSDFRVEKKVKYYKKSRRSTNYDDLRKLYFSQIFITIH